MAVQRGRRFDVSKPSGIGRSSNASAQGEQKAA